MPEVDMTSGIFCVALEWWAIGLLERAKKYLGIANAEASFKGFSLKSKKP